MEHSQELVFQQGSYGGQYSLNLLILHEPLGVQVPPSAPAGIQAAIENDCGFLLLRP